MSSQVAECRKAFTALDTRVDGNDSRVVGAGIGVSSRSDATFSRLAFLLLISLHFRFLV